MAQNFLIFLPTLNYKRRSNVLYGLIFYHESIIAIYVLGERHSIKYGHLSRYQIIGQVTSTESIASERITESCWVHVKLSDTKLSIDKITVITEGQVRNITVITYNKQHIIKSQFLSSNYGNIQPGKVDFIYRLIREVKEESNGFCKKSRCSCHNSNMYSRMLTRLTEQVQKLCDYLQRKGIFTVFKISSFGNHFMNVIETTVYIFESNPDECQSVKSFNYFIARILDAILGKIIIYYVLSYTTNDELFSALVQVQENVVTYLQNTIEWLMGSPAGFKLYNPLNNVLGSFCKGHIFLWWTFLELSNPLLKVIFNFLLFMGNFGISFQLSILADLLAIVTVHIYSIYVYAAKLYYYQMKSLRILSRLFFGKKRNPLPGSVHSSPYTTEQLLFGTVSFTILLFLLPTTLIYYSVFTAVRIILISIGGILTRLKYFFNIFPIYIFLLRLYNPVLLTCTVRLDMESENFPDGTSVTQLKPVCKSLWSTIKICTPEPVQTPNNIEWQKLTTDILTGNLIYPVIPV